jgi:hypothetical protein
MTKQFASPLPQPKKVDDSKKYSEVGIRQKETLESLRIEPSSLFASQNISA